MIFYLIRHGQSANNARPEHERIDDPPLTPIGVRQAELLAEWAASQSVSRILASPFRRALQTAWPIHERTNAPLEVMVDLHERGGCYAGFDDASFEGRPGMNRDQLLRDYPGIFVPSRVDEQGWWKGKPRETDDQARQRVQRLQAEMMQRFAGTRERVLMICHADFKKIFFTQVNGVDRRQATALWNAAFSRFEIGDSGINCVEFNQTHHLTADLMTL